MGWMISGKTLRCNCSGAGCISMVRFMIANQLRDADSTSKDQRNPPDQGRIGDPDDIIATVLVEDSKV